MADIGKDLEGILEKVNGLYERVKQSSTEWWWLDQGDAPIISVSSIRVEGKKVKIERMPKVSIPVALRIIRDSVQSLINFKGADRFQLLHEVSRSLIMTYECVKRVIDANSLVKKLDEAVTLAKSRLGEGAKNFERRAHDIIMRIREVFIANPIRWDRVREKFKREIEEIRNNVVGHEIKEVKKVSGREIAGEKEVLEEV